MSNTRLGAYPAVLLVMATVMAVGGFICGTGTGTPPAPASSGAITVNMGFGAVTSTPYQCQGQGRVTVRPQSLTGSGGSGAEETRTFSYSGSSSTTPNEPACQTNLIFTGKTPGTWEVTDGGATCIANVVAGQSATVKIWNGACS